MPDYKQLVKKGMLRKKPAKRNYREAKKPAKAFFNKAILLLLLGAIMLSLYFGMRYFLLHFSGFRITEVSIVGAQGKPLQNCAGIFRLDSNYNLFNFDMERTVGDIRARHPELADVSLRKQFPNKLLIIVKAREPLAIIASLPDSPLVDKEGFILPFEPSARGLPKIIGIHPKQIRLFAKSQSLRLKRALNLLKELKKAKVYPEYKVSRIDVEEYSNIVFHLKNKIEVKMGAGDFERKAALLGKILAQLKANATVPKYIDMRFDNPAVKP